MEWLPGSRWVVLSGLQLALFCQLPPSASSQVSNARLLTWVSGALIELSIASANVSAVQLLVVPQSAALTSAIGMDTVAMTARKVPIAPAGAARRAIVIRVIRPPPLVCGRRRPPSWRGIQSRCRAAHHQHDWYGLKQDSYSACRPGPLARAGRSPPRTTWAKVPAAHLRFPVRSEQVRRQPGCMQGGRLTLSTTLLRRNDMIALAAALIVTLGGCGTPRQMARG